MVRDRPFVTTPQNPYGPQGRPARPYSPGPHTGPQGHPDHRFPPPQPAWGPGPQAHRAPATNGHSRFDGPSAGHAPAGARTAPPGEWQGGYGVPPQGSGGHAIPPQGGYGAPQYPSGPQQAPQHPQPQPRNGFGVTALVLGILGVLFAMIPIIGVIAWPLAILGLIFGLLGIARARSGKANNTGVAISGTVLSAIALILCIVWVAAFNSAVSSTPTGSLPSASSGSSGGAAPAGGAFPGALSDDVVGNAGDALTVGDMQITATPVKAGDSTYGPETLCTTVTYKNNGSSPGSFNGGFDWKLQDPAGAALMTGFMGSNTILSAGELAPGGSTSGDVCFTRTASTTGQYVLLYDPMDFSSTRGAWLNQVG